MWFGARCVWCGKELRRPLGVSWLCRACVAVADAELEQPVAEEVMPEEDWKHEAARIRLRGMSRSDRPPLLASPASPLRTRCMVCHQLVRDGELQNGLESTGVHEGACSERYWQWACGEVDSLEPSVNSNKLTSERNAVDIVVSSLGSRETTNREGAAQQLAELLAGRTPPCPTPLR